MFWTLLTAGLFLLTSLLHLFYCYQENERARRLSKLALMPLLIAFVISVQKGDWPILLIALLFGYFGDILLIYKKNKTMFLLGEMSFFIGHVVYIILFFLKVGFNSPLLAILITVGAALVIQYPLYVIFRPYYKKLTIPNNIYSTILLISLAFAILVVVYQGFLPSILLPIGALCFMVSDSLIAYNLFYKKQKRHDFYIMVFYLLAQVLLSLGILL